MLSRAKNLAFWKKLLGFLGFESLRLYTFLGVLGSSVQKSLETQNYDPGRTFYTCTILPVT